MTQYAVELTREGAHVLVSFPDFPNVHTYGNDEEEALARALDALETYLSHASRLDQLEQAFLAIKKRLTIAIEDAA